MVIDFFSQINYKKNEANTLSKVAIRYLKDYHA